MVLFERGLGEFGLEDEAALGHDVVADPDDPFRVEAQVIGLDDLALITGSDVTMETLEHLPPEAVAAAVPVEIDAEASQS